MSKTLKHEVKAEYLLDRGMELLWSKGYNGTSVNDIVKAAGIPKGSFYFYFDSKEDFAVKAIDRYFNLQLTPALEHLKAPGISAKQRILNFYEYRTQVVKEQLECKMGCLGCNMANEMAEHNETIRKAVASKSEIVKEVIAEILEEAQEAGDLSKDVKAYDLAGFLEDAGKGAMISMKEMKSAYPMENVLRIVKLFFLK